MDVCVFVSVYICVGECVCECKCVWGVSVCVSVHAHFYASQVEEQ